MAQCSTCRLPSPARNQSPARSGPPQPAAPLQQLQEESKPRWARTPSPEPVIPLPVSQPTSQSTSRSASPAPSPLPPGAIPGRMGGPTVGPAQNGFAQQDAAPPALAPIPTRRGLGQNGFTPRDEPQAPPPLAPIPTRVGAVGPGMGAAGCGGADLAGDWFLAGEGNLHMQHRTMRFGSTAITLAKHMLNHWRISWYTNALRYASKDQILRLRHQQCCLWNT